MKVDNVTAAKPMIGGAVFRAPFGTALPTTASETLDSAFEDLGYISSDGIKNTTEITSEEVKAWGGDVVMTPETGKSDKFTIKFIEATNTGVLKTVHGQDNVTGTLETGITIRVNSKEHSEDSYVIDTVLRGGSIKRLVIPKGKVTAIGEIQYVDNIPVGYDTTISAVPHEEWDGDTHREYILGASTTETEPATGGNG